MATRSAIVLISIIPLSIAASAAKRGDDDPATVVVLIRHAEKGESASSPADPPLSFAGQARAKELAHVLKDSGVDAIYVTSLMRTQQTAEPLATQAGITPISIAAEDVDSLVAQIESQSTGKTILIVGHSNTIPRIIAKFSDQSVPVIADDAFDNLYVITKRGSEATVLRLRYGKASWPIGVSGGSITTVVAFGKASLHFFALRDLIERSRKIPLNSRK